MTLQDKLEQGDIKQLMGSVVAFTRHEEGIRVIALTTSPIESTLLLQPDIEIEQLTELFVNLEIPKKAIFYSTRTTIKPRIQPVFDADIIYSGNIHPEHADKLIERDLDEYCCAFGELFKKSVNDHETYPDEEKQKRLQQTYYRTMIGRHILTYNNAVQQNEPEKEAYLSFLNEFLLLEGADEQQRTNLIESINGGKFQLAHQIDLMAAMLTENFEYLAKIKRLQSSLRHQPVAR